MHPSQRIYCTKSEKLKGKKIVLGITGSIAAVENVKLIRELIRHGAEVFPVMSKEAVRIIHPNSIQFASGKAPIIEIDGSVPYVGLCGMEGESDLLLIAPTTANTIGKIAHGIDDTTVTAFAINALGSGIPIMIMATMHKAMFDNPVVKENIEKLKKLGMEFIEPTIAEEKAKMAGVDDIVASVLRRLGPGDLAKKSVVIIAGSTEEPIDDVRVITNRSTGATGIELAKVAFERGAEVELWMGRHEESLPPYIPTKQFRTIEELQRLVSRMKCDYCLVPAAISDFTVKKVVGKIKSKKEPVNLRLTLTPKILKMIKTKTKGVVIGFKAEVDLPVKELELRALKMLKDLRLNFVVANDVTKVEKDKTSVLVIDNRGKKVKFEGFKAVVADNIWSAILHGVKG